MKCKHCGQAITLDGSVYWTHVDSGLVLCGPNWETQAEPR